MGMKRFLSWLLCSLLIVGSCFPAYADLNPYRQLAEQYLLASASNALMSDSVVPYSSLGTVTNTVDLTDVRCFYYYDRPDLGITNILGWADTSVVNKRLSFKALHGDNYIIRKFGFQLPYSALPSPGTYTFGFDMSSDFTLDILDGTFFSVKMNSNAGQQDKTFPMTGIMFSGGDAYLSGFKMNLTSLNRLTLNFSLADTDIHSLGGSAAFRFLVAASDPSAPSTAGSDTSQQDYENAVSDGIGNIASGVGDIADGIEYISQSQGLIIKGIDNIIMHISDQLYAFWDQLYNLIHVPTLAKMNEILAAIKNLELDVTVDLDELKKSIADSATKISNQVKDSINAQVSNDNKNHEDLIHGYDPSGMDSDKQAVDQAIQEYDTAEKDLMQDVNDGLSGIDFDFDFSSKLTIIGIVAQFLQGLYDRAGGFQIVINLSLILSLASCVIGLYRLKGGG